MGHFQGRISEIRYGVDGQLEVQVTCPEGIVPVVGQYVLAHDVDDQVAVLSTALFLAENSLQGFWAAPIADINWSPGTHLHLVGPLGHGFDLPGGIQRLALVTLGKTVARLLPLVHMVIERHVALTLFTDLNLPKLPAAVEVYPLASLKDSLDWPDFVALELPLERLSDLRGMLGLLHGNGLSCPAQVLITTPMPCAGMAQCGACAIQGKQGWKLVCEDGPVFDLSTLLW